MDSRHQLPGTMRKIVARQHVSLNITATRDFACSGVTLRDPKRRIPQRSQFGNGGQRDEDGGSQGRKRPLTRVYRVPCPTR